MKEVVSTHYLIKCYKNTKAVNGVNMHIHEGEIYGLIGKNGAGKSSLLKMISGLSAPTSGVIETIGTNKIGALIEAPALHLNLSAYENLNLKCIALGIKEKKHKINELLKLLGLSTDKKKVKHYSLGMKQRLGIALALVGDPSILILDEPINGLDPQGIQEIRNIIHRINQEKNITIIISSHILEELTKLATNFGFMNDGILLEELSQKELSEKCKERLEVIVDDVRGAKRVLDEMGITKYEIDLKSKALYVYDAVERSSDISAALIQKTIQVKSLACTKQSLEEFYFGLMEENLYA